MIGYAPKFLPVQLFPGDYCLLCIDPAHPGVVCWMLEYHGQPDGRVLVEPCGCTESVTADAPGRYVLRVNQVQKE